MDLGRKDCFLPKEVNCLLQGRGDRPAAGGTPEGKPSRFPYGEDERKRGRLVLAKRSPSGAAIVDDYPKLEIAIQ